MNKDRQPVTIGCGVVRGVDAVPVVLEVATTNGSAPRILGLAGAGVREAYFRILGAFAAQGLQAPRGVPTINMTPATIPKSGSGFDLPMALGLGGASGHFALPPRLAAVGELSLSGEVLPAPGVIAIALAARDRGWTDLLACEDDARLAARVPGIRAFGAPTLGAAVEWIRGERTLAPARPAAGPPATRSRDLADIRGHETPKQALVVAAAGRHNLLMVGPPGSGKTALVQRLAGLLPPPTEAEALEILKIHTVSGPQEGRLPAGARPVRCPHHSSSAASLLGGGRHPRPGEVSLAQHGVLFLDELPEFRREVIEGLRQPLEDGKLTIGRVEQTLTLPADFLLVCAMNPCPCGYHGHGTRTCSCSPPQRLRYRGRVSGPLLDRIDLQIEVPNLDPRTLAAPPDPAWSTRAVRVRVAAATDRQRRRNRGGVPNGRLQDGALERAVRADGALQRCLEDVLRSCRLSGRARVRLLRIARTLADLEDRDPVTAADILVASRLRGYDVAT